MSRIGGVLGAMLLAVALAGCGSGRGEAVIPEDLSEEEEKRLEAELKTIRSEEAKQPREAEAEKDEP